MNLKDMNLITKVRKIYEKIEMSNLNIQVFMFINVARWPSKNSVKKILTLKPVAAPVEAFGGSKSSASHSASDILTKKNLS